MSAERPDIEVLESETEVNVIGPVRTASISPGPSTILGPDIYVFAHELNNFNVIQQGDPQAGDRLIFEGEFSYYIQNNTYLPMEVSDVTGEDRLAVDVDTTNVDGVESFFFIHGSLDTQNIPILSSVQVKYSFKQQMGTINKAVPMCSYNGETFDITWDQKIEYSTLIKSGQKYDENQQMDFEIASGCRNTS